MINVNLLPKTLRKSRGLDPWKAAAVAVPVLVLGVCGFLQVQASAEEGRLAAEQTELQNELAVLQPFVDEQAALEAERTELAAIEGVATGVRTGRVLWSRQLYAMLETRPTPGPKVASRMAFTNLEMRTLDETTKTQLLTDGTYEGLEAVAEMSVSGLAGSETVVADYIRELQSAPNFAVNFGDMARDAETNFYAFNLTIGAGKLERGAGGADAAATDIGSETGSETAQTGADAAGGIQ